MPMNPGPGKRAAGSAKESIDELVENARAYRKGP
jgi:hypothetical protein